MKRKFLICSIVALTVSFASCTTDTDVYQEQCKSEFSQTESAAELTQKLKAYDSQFTPRKFPLLGNSKNKEKLSWLDWLKVGIADVKGGIAGFAGGGIAGSALGAAISSLEKYIEIYTEKNKEKSNKVECSGSLIASNGVSNTFNDSIGYYHNMAEEMLYDKYGNSAGKRNIGSLLSETNTYLSEVSSYYRRTCQLTNLSRYNLQRRLKALKNIKDSTSVDFFDYCDKVKEIEPADSSYIDFAAEYLYTCVCANVGDIKGYTQDVLRHIDGSNAASRTKEILSSSVLIGFSSLMYSSQIECEDIKQ